MGSRSSQTLAAFPVRGLVSARPRFSPRPRSRSFGGLANELSIELLGSCRLGRQHRRDESGIEERCRGCESGGRSVAAPHPAFGSVDESRTCRVEHDIDAHLQEIRIRVDRGGCVRAGEQMTEPIVTSIELVRMTTEKPLHPGTQCRPECLDHYMEVGVHQAERVNTPFESFANSVESCNEGAPVFIVLDDSTARVAACDDVVNSTCSLRA